MLDVAGLVLSGQEHQNSTYALGKIDISVWPAVRRST